MLVEMKKGGMCESVTQEGRRVIRVRKGEVGGEMKQFDIWQVDGEGSEIVNECLEMKVSLKLHQFYIFLCVLVVAFHSHLYQCWSVILLHRQHQGPVRAAEVFFLHVDSPQNGEQRREILTRGKWPRGQTLLLEINRYRQLHPRPPELVREGPNLAGLEMIWSFVFFHSYGLGHPKYSAPSSFNFPSSA